jgi:hypothetical protein
MQKDSLSNNQLITTCFFINFLTNEKITNIFTNNFLTLNNIYLLKFYSSKISSFSNSPSNSSNSSSRSTSLSRNSINLDEDLQPIPRSLGQFLLTNIDFSKFSVNKRHFLRLVSILAKKKIFLFELRSNNTQNLSG